MANLTAILGQIIEPEAGGFSAALANHLLSLCFPAAMEARSTELSEKAQQGTLTPQEQSELDAYLAANTALILLKSKARASLRTREGRMIDDALGTPASGKCPKEDEAEPAPTPDQQPPPPVLSYATPRSPASAGRILLATALGVLGLFASLVGCVGFLVNLQESDSHPIDVVGGFLILLTGVAFIVAAWRRYQGPVPDPGIPGPSLPRTLDR